MNSTTTLPSQPSADNTPERYYKDVTVHPKSQVVATIKERDETGRAIRNTEQRALDHEAASMRSKGQQFKEIAAYFGVGVTTAYDMVARAWGDVPLEDTVSLVTKELGKLDILEARYYDVMEKHHSYVSPSGKVAVDLDGVPIDDDGPVLQAMAGLLRVADRRAKLLGLNAPTRTELTGVMVTANATANSEKAKASVMALLARLRDE